VVETSHVTSVERVSLSIHVFDEQNTSGELVVGHPKMSGRFSYFHQPASLQRFQGGSRDLGVLI